MKMDKIIAVNPHTNIEEKFFVDREDADEKITELYNKGYSKVTHHTKTILSDIWGL